MTPQARMIIGGRLIQGARTLEVINPALGEVFTSCACADAEQIEAAVAAAGAAFPAWSASPHRERRNMLFALADRMIGEADGLARLLTCEQGKPLGDARGEIMAAAEMIRYFAAARIEDEVIRDDSSARIVVHRAPLGVVAIITPWNSPVMMLAAKLAPALRAGNAVVCKPAASTPLSTLAIGAFCAEIFPPGVVNVVVDRNDLGGLLTGHRDVAKISFTGSTATGRKVMESAAANLTPVTLELGGNDAAIVLDDADIEEVAPQLVRAATRNAGQVCVATKRAYVPQTLYEQMCGRLAALAADIVVGNGLDEGVTMGPIQNRGQYEKVLGYLQVAARDGRVLTGGKPLAGQGYFVLPTIVSHIAPTSRLVTEEQFGPILPVLPYDDVEDVIRQVNASPYGLGATVWSGTPSRGEEVAARIEAGMVWVNKYMDLRFDVPFGGVKASGVGVEMGQEGLLAYMRRTVVNAAPDAVG